MTERLGLILLLAVLGAGWGVTQPLAKIAVSEGYRHLGIVFWQLVLTGVGLTAVTRARGRRVPFGRRFLGFYAVIALIAPVFYALEGNVVAKYGTAGLDPIQLLAGAAWVGAALALPMALATGTWIDPRPPRGAPDRAILVSSLVHAAVYTGYVWTVARAGAVFAAQVSYLVTGFGVIWAMLILGERYTGWVWLAMGLTFVGLFLVQPRRKAALVPPGRVGQDARR